MKARIYSLGGVVPVPVITVKRLPGRLIGICLGPFVLIHGDYADDWPTVVHELEHCKQFWRGGMVVHFALYYMSRAYRLRCELAAFRAELDACAPSERGSRLDDSARALATGYRLEMDAAVCRRLLVAASVRPGAL
jgi:hypothetical protein